VTEAARASSGCRLIVYTSVACTLGSSAPPQLAGRQSRTGHACYLAFLDEACIGLAQCAKVSQGVWRVITHRRTLATAGMPPRRLSKVPKHLPHLYFPGAQTFFLDSKLKLTANPNRLLAMALGQGAHYAFFGHPRVCARGCANANASNGTFFDWMTQEFHTVLDRNGTSEAQHLQEQLRRYQHRASSGQVARAAYTTYADGAIILRDASPSAVKLSERVATEFLRPKNGDRDQPAMTFAFAQGGSQGVRMLESVPPYCGVSCHWYYDNSVAALRRRPPKNRSAFLNSPAFTDCVRRLRKVLVTRNPNNTD